MFPDLDSVLPIGLLLRLAHFIMERMFRPDPLPRGSDPGETEVDPDP